jgi:hypothetical protein
VASFGVDWCGGGRIYLKKCFGPDFGIFKLVHFSCYIYILNNEHI